MNPDVRNLVAAVAALLLALVALRVLGQMAAGHAVRWLRQDRPRRSPPRR